MLQVLEIRRQLLRQDRFHQRAHLGIAQLSLGLPLELRVFHHRQHHGGHALAEVVAAEVRVLVPEHAQPAREVVHHLGVGGLEARLVRAALGRGDVVDVGKHVFGVAVGVLNRHAEDHVLPLPGQIDRLLVKRGLVRVQVAHVIDQPAVKAVYLALRGLRLPVSVVDGLALVKKRDRQPPVQVRQLAQAARDGLGVERDRLKHAVVRQKPHPRAALLGVAHQRERPGRAPGHDLLLLLVPRAFKADVPVLKVAAHVHLHPPAQGVYHARAHAVQAAGIGVVLTVKLAARVQLGIDHLHAGYAHGRVEIDGHAPPVVLHGHRPVAAQRHVHARGKAGHGLVDGIVHNLPQHVVQPARPRGADVHAGPHAHGVQPFQHLNVSRVVMVGQCISPLGGLARARKKACNATLYYSTKPRFCTRKTPAP